MTSAAIAAPIASAANPQIAIIGGGITGLAAAHRISELLPHAKLSLFEAAPRLGGLLETVYTDGFLIERSADNFLAKNAAALELCRRLGIELLSTDESRRRAFVVRDGRLLAIPDGFFLMAPRRLGPMLASPILSVRGKLRLLAEPFIPRHRIALNHDADESVASFARRRLGRETFERLVEPLVAGIYTGDAETLSMAAAMPEFFALEQSRGSLRFPSPLWEGAGGGARPEQASSASGARYSLFTAPREGMSSLVTALVSRLTHSTIHLNAPVARIAQTSDARWQVDVEHRASSIPPPASLYDALILALPAHVAARLLESHDRELSGALAGIEYSSCAVVSFGFDCSEIAHPLDGFGVVVPRIEKRRIIAASFASRKFPGRAPGDAALIRTFIGGALQPGLVDLPDNGLRQLALEELRELLGIRGEPRVTDITRWPRSMPQYHVGHVERVARIEQLAIRHPTLALAGNAYHGVGIPQCIASGEAAAKRIVSRLA
jgi:oxygen-dependent protoporphyrinogen oxidase